jgi:hypothetical protein
MAGFSGILFDRFNGRTVEGELNHPQAPASHLLNAEMLVAELNFVSGH